MLYYTFPLYPNCQKGFFRRRASETLTFSDAKHPKVRDALGFGCAQHSGRSTHEILSVLLGRTVAPCRQNLLSLSRKEVIQPQVPLRLPCYDFAPVMKLAFGRSLPCGLGNGLRALPTSMA